MVVEIFQDSAAFKHHVDFYNQSKGLLNWKTKLAKLSKTSLKKT
jgi:hypothetical protein